jgi:hypothetical protein
MMTPLAEDAPAIAAALARQYEALLQDQGDAVRKQVQRRT